MARSVRGPLALLAALVLVLTLQAGCVEDFRNDGVVPSDEEEQFFLLGRHYYLRSQYTEAMAQFEKQLKAYPKGSWADDAHYYRGRIFYDMLDYVQARAEFAITIAWSPVSNVADYAQFWTGRTYEQEGNYAQALIEYQKVITNYPLSPIADGAHYQIGYIHYLQGVAFQKAVIPDTVNAAAEFSLALPEFQTVITQYPQGDYADNAQCGIGEVHQALADSQILLNNVPGAVTEFEAARVAYNLVLANYPLSNYADNAQFLIGDTYLSQGLAFQGATVPDPVQAAAAFNKAIPAFQLVLSLFAQSTYADNAQYDLGRTHHSLALDMVVGAASEFAAARAAYNLVFTNYPQSSYHDNAQYYIGRTYFDELNYNQALVELNKLITGYPTSSYVDNALYYIGRSHQAIGGAAELSAARTAYQSVWNQFPASAYVDNALYHYATTYHDAGDCRSEYPAMQNFLNLFPTSFYATYAANHLASILAGKHTCTIPYP